jgi:hypothetical protein
VIGDYGEEGVPPSSPTIRSRLLISSSISRVAMRQTMS